MTNAGEPIIEFLESVRKRPQMYIEELDAQLMECFINGFIVGCFASSKDERFNILHSLAKSEALAHRGWNIGAHSLGKKMAESGMLDEAIIDELLAIEIDTWRRVPSKL